MLRILIAGTFLLIAAFLVDRPVRELFLHLQNPVLDFFMQWFTHIGTLFMIMFILVSLILYDEGKKRPILPLWLSFFTSLLVTHAIKFIIQRPRPSLLFVVPFIHLIDYSFPSTHTALAFCVVPLVRHSLPRVKWFFIVFACFIGISRLYLDAHYLSDVIGGGIVGLIVGFLVLKAWQAKASPAKGGSG